MVTTLHDRRSALAVIAGASAAIGTVALVPSSWSERFDPATWIERWYRAGHRIVADVDGRPILLSSLNSDEEERSATVLRGELGYPGNRKALVRYLNHFRPSRSGAVCGYVAGVA